MMKNYSEEDIKEIAALIHTEELKQLPDNDVLREEYTLSDTFAAKMKKLLRRMKRREAFKKAWLCTAVAAVGIFILFTVSYPGETVEACRSVMQWLEDFAVFQFKDEVTIQKIPKYEAAYLPEGYKLTLDNYSEVGGEIGFSNGSNTWYLLYSFSDGVTFTNNERITFSILILNDGRSVYYFKANNEEEYSTMHWLSEDENIVFFIVGILSKEEMLNILDGVKEEK